MTWRPRDDVSPGDTVDGCLSEVLLDFHLKGVV